MKIALILNLSITVLTVKVQKGYIKFAKLLDILLI